MQDSAETKTNPGQWVVLCQEGDSPLRLTFEPLGKQVEMPPEAEFYVWLPNEQRRYPCIQFNERKITVIASDVEFYHEARRLGGNREDLGPPPPNPRQRQSPESHPGPGQWVVLANEGSDALDMMVELYGQYVGEIKPGDQVIVWLCQRDTECPMLDYYPRETISIYAEYAAVYRGSVRLFEYLADIGPPEYGDDADP